MDENETIGQRIRRLRTAKGLTQEGLASGVGVTEQAISKWEAGHGRPGLDSSMKLAAALGVSLDFLLTGARKTNSRPMSTYEYACLTNDGSTLENGSLFKKDEFGHTLLDYIERYDAIDVFAKVLSKMKGDPWLRPRYEPINERVLGFLFRAKKLPDVYKFGYRDMGTWTLRNYPGGEPKEGCNAFLVKMMQPPYFSSRNFAWLLTADSRDFIGTDGKTHPFSYEYATYQTMYPLYAEAAMYAKNAEAAEEAIRRIETVNGTAIQKAKEEKGVGLTTDIKYVHDIYLNGYSYAARLIRCIGIPKHVYEAAIAFGYSDLARRLDAINRAVGKEGFDLRECELIDMKKSGRFNDEDITIASYTRDGIFEIERFLKDVKRPYRLLQRALKLPLLRVERFSSCLKEGNYRAAFEMAVDGDLEVKEKLAAGFTREYLARQFETESLEKPTAVEKRNLDFIKSTCRGKSFKDNREMLRLFREEILKRAKIQEDTAEALKELSSDILVQKLEKGQYRHCASDIVSKLEFLLRAKAGIDKDQEEEFDLVKAIGENFNGEASQLLQKIRLYRNQRVHLFKKNDIELSEDDFRSAIKIVDELAKEVQK